MSAAVFDFPIEEARPSDWREPGTHEVFIRVWRRRLKYGRFRDAYTVEESRAGGDWWGFVADAVSFDEAARIALAHVEPGGVILLMMQEDEGAI